MNLQNSLPALKVGEGEFNLHVEPATPEKGGVEYVHPVGGSNDLNVRLVEPVQLAEQLEHGPLHLPVARLVAVRPLAPDGVYLVDEDDAGGLGLRECEGVPHEPGPLPDVHLHELGARQLEEVGLRVGGTRPRHQGLPGARGAVQQHPLWRLDVQLLEPLLVEQGEHDGLVELLDLVLEAPYRLVGLRCHCLLQLHNADLLVEVAGQLVEDDVRVLVQRHLVPWLQLGLRREAQVLEVVRGAEGVGDDAALVPRVLLQLLVVRPHQQGVLLVPLYLQSVLPQLRLLICYLEQQIVYFRFYYSAFRVQEICSRYCLSFCYC